MNSILREVYPLFQMYQALRDQLMASITSDDLTFTPGGDNLSLGALCREMGEVQYAYIQSFKTFKQDFSYRNEEPGLEGNVERLTDWFKHLDGELKAAIESLTEEDIQNRTIDRGGDFIISPRIQLEVYKEALLIFYGKVSVYLKANGKIPSEQWLHWIG